MLEVVVELTKLIRERRTIQSFTNEKVPDQWVREAMELSLWAPNHRLTFPWYYKLVDGGARQRLADLAVELKGKKAALSETAKQAVRATVTIPSHLLMLGLKPEADDDKSKENYATLACSVQILSLVLWEKGVGVKWSTAGFTRHLQTHAILGIPDAIQLEGCLFIGKAQVIPPASPRPAIADICD